MRLYKEEKIAAFYRIKNVCSNFYRSNIQYDNITFKASEHLFMYFKAIHFSDFDVAQRIIQANTPIKAKSLGRKVKNYNEEEWDKVRYDYMLSAVKLKIEQNKHIKEQLIPLRKEGYSFVEASPTDLIWEVGLEENNPSIVDKNNWKGTNLLGKAIDEALDLIIKDMQYE